MERLMYAMAEHEGWEAPSPDKASTGTIAFRQNNPGNLRSSPFMLHVKNGFAVFESDMIGFAAFQYDLTQKAKGNTSTGLNGESTLRDLIYKWAPPSDNNATENYLQSVMKMTGFTDTMKLKELLK